MHKVVEKIVLLADIVEGSLPEAANTDDEMLLVNVISDAARYGAYVHEDVLLEEYCQKFCEAFVGCEKYAEMFGLILELNKINAETKLNAEELIEYWQKVLDAYYRAKEDEEYNLFDYLGDVVKIKFISNCYFNIASHTKEIRKVATELQATRDDYGRIEQKMREI